MSYSTSTKQKRRLAARIAQNQLEIERALALRYDVFRSEMKAGVQDSSADAGKDRDRYDLYCDHLVVVDEEHEDRVVGTYRILRRSVALANEGFYSENEFDLTRIYALERNRPKLVAAACTRTTAMAASFPCSGQDLRPTWSKTGFSTSWDARLYP